MSKSKRKVDLELHLCKKTKPFEMMDDYHYYNPVIYSMDAYFNGQNLRQMKRYSYIIWRLLYGYENLYKHRMLYGPNKNIDKMLEITRDLCVHGNKVIEDLSQWKAESKFSVHRDKYFSEYSRCKAMPIEAREEKIKKAKYVIHLDKYGHEKKELITKEDFEKHWPSFIEIFEDESRLFVSWGHWLTYLFESDLESGEDTGLDLGNLNELIQKGKKFEDQLIDFKFGKLK